jgi:hypothetical protein
MKELLLLQLTEAARIMACYYRFKIWRSRISLPGIFSHCTGFACHIEFAMGENKDFVPETEEPSFFQFSFCS